MLYIQQWRKNVSKNRQTSSDEYNARVSHNYSLVRKYGLRSKSAAPNNDITTVHSDSENPNTSAVESKWTRLLSVIVRLTVTVEISVAVGCLTRWTE
jgi:hypothetical protein